jgi:hypothetical protein
VPRFAPQLARQIVFHGDRFAFCQCFHVPSIGAPDAVWQAVWNET